MTSPNADTETVPSPAELRAMLKAARITYPVAARRVGMSRRTLERYLTDAADPTMPYPLYFTLRALCTGESNGR